ncbi:MAG: hypothetical protein WCG83_03135 [Candidatus Peregrinibacteria bacterium]
MIEDSPASNAERPLKEYVRELTSFDNPRLPEYRELISRAAQRGAIRLQEEDFASHFRNMIRTLSLKTHLQSRLIGVKNVDLGGGSPTGSGSGSHDFANECGATVYVNVDRGLSSEYANSLSDVEHPLYPGMQMRDPSDLRGADGLGLSSTEIRESTSVSGLRNLRTPSVYIAADMLDFVARMPAGSACLQINGIDTTQIQAFEYHQALAREIGRVIRGGGIVFGCDSTALDPALMLQERLMFVPPLLDRKDQEYAPENWYCLGEGMPRIYEAANMSSLSANLQKQFREKIAEIVEIDRRSHRSLR